MMSSSATPKVINRDNTIDIARGIAISLVVIGHSGISPYFWNIIYFFHMPLFFFMSGCFLKPIDNITFNTFIKKLRWKELYKNFVIYSILFLIISPLLYQWGISNTPTESIKDFFERLIIICRFRTSTIDLLGQFWFLPVLFFTHALSLCTVSLIKVKNKILILGISICFYISGYFCFLNGYKEPYDFSRILYFSGFYLWGYLSYPLLNNLKDNIYILFITISGIIYFSLIPELVFTKTYLYCLSSLAGIFLVIYCSSKLGRGILLNIIGKHTLPIFIFHPFIMKITELLLSLFNVTTFSKGWPGANPANPYWWLYSIMGIFIPLGCLSLHKYFKNKLSQTE